MCGPTKDETSQSHGGDVLAESWQRERERDGRVQTKGDSFRLKVQCVRFGDT